jgi:oligosaccharide repeat unit polymerase
VIWAVVILSAVLTAANRITARTWFAPAPFFCAYWFLNLVMGALLSGIFPVTTEGFVVLASMMVAFSVGAAAMNSPGSVPGEPSEAMRFDFTAIESRLYSALVVLSALAFLGVMLEARAVSQQFSLTLSLLSFFELGAAASSARYAEISAGAGGLATMLVYCIVAAAPLGGVVSAASARRRWRLAGLAPIVLSALEGTVMASRAGILLAFCMWGGGWLATRILVSRGRLTFGTRRVVLVGGGLLAGAVVVYGALQWVRWGVGSSFAWQPIAETAAASLMGHVSTFSQWITIRGAGSPTFGAYTFAGPFALLGIAPRSVGLFTDPVYFPGGAASNIYTAFRALIEDYTLAGAWVICLAAGATATRCYQAVRSGRSAWVMVLALFYAFVLFSWLASMLYFSSVVAAWVIAIGGWFLAPRVFVAPTRAPETA